VKLMHAPGMMCEVCHAWQVKLIGADKHLRVTWDLILSRDESIKSVAVDAFESLHLKDTPG
jgi:hypothetical protein